MKLDRVTITGADDSIRPYNLALLSERFPFVEWGILASFSSAGGPRFPTINWVKDLQALTRTGAPMVLSLHLCGRWVRSLLVGTIDFPMWLLDGFQRVQLNFHAERCQISPVDFARALDKLGNRHFIFQVDGARGADYLESMLVDRGDCYPLFDVSGGAGVLPAAWPKAEYMQTDALPMYHGYAGGLGPDNLAEQIPKIAEAAGPARFWIDMETRVRSNNDRQFDLEKVTRCLEIAAPLIEGATSHV